MGVFDAGRIAEHTERRKHAPLVQITLLTEFRRQLFVIEPEKFLQRLER